MSSFRLIFIGALYIIFFFALLASCSSDSGSGPIATPESTQVGNFRDSGVSGLHYSSRSYEGETRIERGPDGTILFGSFSYIEGEDVTFSLGGVTLGKTRAKKNITPIDLVDGAEDATDPSVINMCRFLITLDQNGDPEDGIVISKRTQEVMKNYSFSLDDPLDMNPNIPVLLEELNGITPEEGEEQHTFSLCSKEFAISHFENTLIQIEQEQLAEIEAENAELKVTIVKPQFDAIIMQGHPLAFQGTALGGSKQYTYSWELKSSSDEIVFQSTSATGTSQPLGIGNYALVLNGADLDGNTASDQRLIAVLDPASLGSISTRDESVQFDLPSILSVKTSESFNLKAVIKKGNPPFCYRWMYPEQASFSSGDNPLDAVFSFSSPGTYSISLSVEETNKPDDFFNHTVDIKVEK